MRRALLILAVLALPTAAFAHGGGVDSKGGHRCKRNCERHGMMPGQYHFHPTTMDEDQLRRFNRFRDSLCNRVRNRFAKSPTSFERVNKRVSDRFGFICGGLGSTPRETGVELRRRLRAEMEVLQDAPPDRVTVNRVLDGDTLEVRFNNGKKEDVRLIGIDAPEIDTYGQHKQCFSGEAFLYMRQMLGRSRVELLRRPGDNRDKYGRLLRYVHFRGRDVGRDLLEEGYARNYPWFEHPRSEQYALSEWKAQNAERGLWRVCK